MPPKKKKPNPISLEWGQSLVGLPMAVPENWWTYCTGYNLHNGKIVSFDQKKERWNLLLDSRDDDELYGMNYEALCKYSDELSSTFDDYHLTYQPVRMHDEEIATAKMRYTKTPACEWSRVEDGVGRVIEPIERDGDEEFSVKITDEEVESLKDDGGEIRYEKVFQWALPKYGDNDDQSIFEFQAARMRNYMKKRVLLDGYKPRYYTGDKVIKADHVARFYGACLGKMLTGGRSIEQIFSTREIFDAVPSIQAAMTKGALEDLTTCLHYSDDWDVDEDQNWEDTYDDVKVEAAASTASHRLKHGRLEDGYNKVCTVLLLLLLLLFESILNSLSSFLPSFLPLRGGKLLLTLASGLLLMKVE